ncbi:MAG: ribonuclease P protein component [Spirochaetales bacterium]|nr:ribonuclease P protein component [Spirochaetales bacterium]
MCLRKKSLTRKERLCKRNDIKRLFKEGKRARYKGLYLLYRENKYEINRITVVAKKGFQNAVIRNRQKRLVKEAYRHLKLIIKSGYDIIIFVVPGSCSYNEYFTVLRKLFCDNGFISGQVKRIQEKG